ncbi:MULTISPECIES: hypothetical protein [unclassified Marinitoga]|uniref:hypothetical protein n=1 Tax=unclassified Marinitoga TaxID=2640159 RepID=UPI0006416AAA|nr:MULTISPECIES: hypothetical protein [unclassified Marinitoga]KLO22504.1 hypothetical protein X274_08015 [Marinitoga sp. 1155]NUV00416.1 hypothetical protein [Marinitoga sp. 1154]
MEGWIPTKRLLKITEFADKLCGNVEPIHRYIYLYFDKVLRVSMTDGCAVANILFSKEFFPFEKVYKIPIQHLKGLLKGLNEKENPFIRMLALDEGLKIELENMVLNIESENDKKPVFKIKEPILISSVNLKSFIKSLDFCSIQGMEGDLIRISSYKEDVYGYFSGYNIYTYSYLGKTSKSFSIEIPYVTIRHLVKSLSLISDEKIDLYLNTNALLIKSKGLYINVCNNKISDNFKIDFNFKPLEELKINTEEFKKILNKIYTTLPSNIKIYIIFGKDSYIIAKDKNTTITWKLNLKFKYKYLIEINPRKFRSLLSRLKNKVLIKTNENSILFIDNNNFLDIKVKEFSK